MARLLGLSDEQRLEIEQATGMKTEGVRVILEASLQQAEQLTKQVLDKTIREVQEVVGPHGSVTRLQAGGVKISQGLGIAVYEDGVLKTTIEPDGDFLVGSDTTQPATTSFAVFVNEQTYNNELMGAGDLLFGDNTEAVSNVKFDASEGQLQFRYGQTVNVYMDTDGSLKAGGGVVILDENGTYIELSESLNELNSYKFGLSGTVYAGLYGFRNNAAGITSLWTLIDDANADTLISSRGRTGFATAKLQAVSGDDSTPDSQAAVVANTTPTNGQVTIQALSYPPESGTPNIYAEILLEASQSGGNVVINDSGGDINTRIEGNTDPNLFVADAGLDAIGIGGAVESGYKLKVSGKVNLTTGNTYDINGTPHTHTGLVTNGDSHDHSGGDGGTVAAGSVSVADAGGYFTGTDVEAALQELGAGGGGGGASSDGWNAAASTWTYSSVDDPTGIISTSADETGNIGIGDRIRFTNGGNTIYGIVTAITSSLITFLHEIDPADSLAKTLMANSAITVPYYSHVKNPLGFPPKEESWTFWFEDTTNATLDPSGGTIYNPGSLSLNIPIGSWRTTFYMLAEGIVNLAATQLRSVKAGLSTSNSSYSDEKLTDMAFLTVPALSNAAIRAGISRTKTINLASKTTHYFVANLGGATDGASLSLRGDVIPTRADCVCAYL